MKIALLFCMLTLLHVAGYSQVPNDDCGTAFDYGVFPDSAGPQCPNGVFPYVGAYDDLSNVTPSSPFYSMTGCQGYVSSTTTLADDIWYKYRGIYSASNVMIIASDTLHVNFYYGTNCNVLQPAGCFTYLPSYNDTIFTIYSNNDTINYYNYIQISSNESGKQFLYTVCLYQPMLLSATAYGTIQINNNVSIYNVYSNISVSVFPNPLTNKLNIISNSDEKIEVVLSDIAGRIVHQEAFSSSLSMNTEQLAKGTYLYELRNKNGIVKIGKVVKD